jgi:hypothetical protein
MTIEEQVLYDIENYLAQLPRKDQIKIKEAELKIQEILLEYGDHGKTALALLGARLAASEIV